jgi:hypothetical protein
MLLRCRETSIAGRTSRVARRPPLAFQSQDVRMCTRLFCAMPGWMATMTGRVELLGAALPPEGFTTMRAFTERELHSALAFPAGGGQALHLISPRYAYLRKDTPACFKKRSILAHLFDADRDRLESTARRLGVRVIRVERESTSRQHIDLRGKPLERAIAITEAGQVPPSTGLATV